MMIIFSIIYGIISYSFEYYGEMVTYLGRSAPMAVYALVSWLRNPYKGKKSEVTVNEVNKREIVIILVLSVIVTELVYFILKEFGTANLLPSTVSVIVCFVMFLMNDTYSFINWTRMKKKQSV